MKPLDPQSELKEEIKRSIQSGVPIDPELMEYARSFMNLPEENVQPRENLEAPILPKNYNELAQQEANSQQSILPENYNELAQQEANSQRPPLPENYNELAQQEANSQQLPLPENYNELAQQESQEMDESQESISPNLMDYAYNIFPALNQISPRRSNYVESDRLAEEPISEELSQKEETPQQIRQVDTKKPVAVDKLVAPATAKSPVAEVTQQQITLPREADLNIDSMLRKARKEEDTADYFADLAKFRDSVMGVGIGRVPAKTDLSTYDAMRKRAQRPMQDFLLKNELADKKSKIDPNSDISKLMRKSLSEIGLDMTPFQNVSYSQLEKVYPNLASSLAAKINRDAKREQAIMMNNLREDARLQGLSNKEMKLKDDQLNQLVKRSENIFKSDEYKLYNSTKPTVALLDEAIRRWDSEDESYKESAQAAFMGYAKTAQQDASVVRESDMKVLAGGVNYGNLGGVLSRFLAKGQGASFSPEELASFKAVVQVVQDIKRKDLQSRFSPILVTAQKTGLTPDYFVSPDVLQDIYSAPKKETNTIEDSLKSLEAKLNANQSRIDSLRNKEK
jgi:hypothetical protein